MLEYRDAPKVLAALMPLFEHLHIVHCSKEGKRMAMKWAGLYCGHFAGH